MPARPEHSTPISHASVDGTAITSEPENIGIGPGAHDDIAGPFALRAKGASGTILASSYQASRDSQASFASATTRTSSIADSVFSTSGLRSLSTYSNSVRLSSARQDSLDSEPVSAISPWETDKYKSGFDLGHRYFCTFCDRSFESKSAWRSHELDTHGESGGYGCKSCGDSFPTLASLSLHLQAAHGSDCFTAAMDPGLSLAGKRAWGCGFCASPVYSHAAYLSHVEAHFDEGKERVHWTQLAVVKALLHQPLVRHAWESRVSREEAQRGAKLRFDWNEQTSLTLQNMLECFVAHNDVSKSLAEFAISHADVKAERNVTGKCISDGVVSRIAEPGSDVSSFRSKLPHGSSFSRPPGRISPHRHSPLALGPPPSELPKSWNAPTPPSSNRAAFSTQAARQAMQLNDSALCILGRIDEANSPPTPEPAEFSSPHGHSPHQSSTKGSLRRVESDWDLGTFRAGGEPLSGLGIPRPKTSLASRPAISASRLFHTDNVALVQSPVSHVPPSPLGAHAACEQWLMVSKPNTLPSRRTPSGSSLVSCHTAEQSRSTNSASECATDDSTSEPDTWLELNDNSVATRQWAQGFHHNVDGVMDCMWVRYNREWDALITRCAGEQSGNPSQYVQSGGLGQSSAMPHLAPDYGSRSNHYRQPSDDKEDEDEVDRHRPSSSQSKRSSSSPKRYACPFRKHDPRTYNLQDHEICTVRSWDSVSRMKEHLYRKHCKVHCVRCKRVFRKPAELDLHEISAEGCQVREVRCPADITAQQERQLKSKRYATRYQTEEEKWREVYRLLFPGEAVPSPYPELADDIKPATPESRNSMDFQHFLLVEMPGIFRQTAEVHAGRRIDDHESLTMESIGFVIAESINKAFQQWESSGLPVPRHLSPTSFIPESSVHPSPSLPIETPVMQPFVQEPADYVPFPEPAVESFWSGQDPTMVFPPEMAHLSAHGNDSGFVEQQPTFPPVTNGYSFNPGLGFDPGYNHGGDFGCQPWGQ